MAKSIVSASDTNRRLAAEHGTLIDEAVDRINALIRKASGFPVVVPCELLTDVVAVRHDLLRRLREDGGWIVETNGPLGVDPLPGDNYLLYHSPSRREVKNERKTG